MSVGSSSTCCDAFCALVKASEHPERSVLSPRERLMQSVRPAHAATSANLFPVARQAILAANAVGELDCWLAAIVAATSIYRLGRGYWLIPVYYWLCFR